MLKDEIKKNINFKKLLKQITKRTTNKKNQYNPSHF